MMASFHIALVAEFCFSLTSAYFSDQVKDMLVWADDPEPKSELVLPSNADAYSKNTAGADSLGSVIAGMSEFPYLVDIQLITRDQEDWAIGNLLSHKTVLTSCRWSTFYLKVTTERNLIWAKEKDKDRWQIANPDAVVYFAPLYIHESQNVVWDVFWKGADSKDYSGTRSVKFVSSHPQCEVDQINYDFAVLTLSRGIPPILPYIAYMPIRIERSNLLITDFDLSHHENKRIVCHIGSFGREYANWKRHLAIGYKVRYRVYFENWDVCSQHFKKYQCPASEQDPPHAPGSFFEAHQCPSELVAPKMTEDIFSQGFENLICFNSRARVGAVCNHDAGAPLVCDGKVFGIVTRGVHFNYCNHMLPVPFIVSKITPASDYYINLARKPYTFSLLVDRKEVVAHSLAIPLKSSTQSCLLTLIVCLIWVCF